MKKKMKTRKEIEKEIMICSNQIETCVTQQFVKEIKKATLEWVVGERETLQFNFILEKR